MPPRSTRSKWAAASNGANDSIEAIIRNLRAEDDEESDSSGDEAISGDDYQEEGEEANNVANDEGDDPASRGNDDAVFKRIAAQVSRGAVGSTQDFSAELAALDEEDLLDEGGRRKRGKRGYRGGVYRGHRPTYEVQQLLGRANMAYISQNHTEAINLFLEVIRHDNMVQAAWTTLASVFEEMGDVVSARQMKFCAAHIEEDAGTWAELAHQFRSEDNMTQAQYCYRKLLRLDPNRVDVLWQLITMYTKSGQAKKAAEAIKKLHKADPTFLRDFNMLMEVHPFILELHQWGLGATVFGDAFVYHYATFADSSDPDNTMKIEHVVEYVNYLIKSGETESAIDVIHRGQRWLQGRKLEKAWDAVEDDSEYAPKRLGGEDGDGSDEETNNINGGNELDVQLRHLLAIARLRLGQTEMAIPHVNMILELDAKVHEGLFKELGDNLMKRQLFDLALECWLALHERSETDTDFDEDPRVVYKMGICLHQLKRYTEAHESLEWAVDHLPHDSEVLLAFAAVLEDMGRKTEALEIVARVLQHGDSLPSGDGTHKGKAGRMNKRVLETQAAYTMQGLWDDVQKAEEGINNGDPWALDKFIHSAGTMIETFRLARSNFTKNRGIVRIPKRRKYGTKSDLTSQAQAMQDRLERIMGLEDDTPIEPGRIDYEIRRQTEFYGIRAEDWLALTIKYCCVLMVKGEEDVAYDILEHVVWSGLFNSRRCEIALRLTIVACGIRMRKGEAITENCKRLAQLHQFRPEPMLLMLAALGGGFKGQGVWHNLALQKFLHREVRIYDEAVAGVKLRYNRRHRRWAQVLESGRSRRLGDVLNHDMEDDDDTPHGTPQRRRIVEDDDEDLNDDEGDGDIDGDGDGDGEGDGDSMGPAALAEEALHECPKPTKYSPVFNTMYGQNMLTTRSYQSALFYFMRAYEVNPHDHFLCFLIAQAFFGRATNRQSDNRNYQIAQGLAFLSRYRKLSPQDPESLEEVEYNFGRSFHGLGVMHLAVTHYERVLTSVRARMDAEETPEERELVRQGSLAWESAHNLCLIYTTSGSLDLVRRVSEEWLALVDYD
ncbi:TPR-like protein [Cutaneotrichosporon oleaginosum]|uniref:TPR-like protein n=1 Tax=Cutaneotrichosporon oleaginosum TaxID=879819 RepID=A0A0J0XDA2_9TREE|nr:TPR-like protein [Cutaneotrichosporon oleaginosum]KLT39056.1 TPR-like protein [Cutaneotrichosporon oleaginosum]TXT11840.1 hypothetical protein COLE_02250 [Cutaneotrichosporon oleaginosum]